MLLTLRPSHRARCFNSKRTSFHVALELEHVESVNLRSAIRKADAVLPAFARAGQRGDTLKRVARRGRCRLLFRVGVQHIERTDTRRERCRPGAQAQKGSGHYYFPLSLYFNKDDLYFITQFIIVYTALERVVCTLLAE